MGKILVVGSINMDYTVMAPHFPVAGETVAGTDFQKAVGGKGNNQAVAASRLGGDVTFLGAVGKDADGEFLLNRMQEENINTNNVIETDEPTGMALITVAELNNTIVIVEGANSQVRPTAYPELSDLIDQHDIIVLQLEIPIETVEYVISEAHRLNKIIILDPAPAQELSQKTIEQVTYLLPNETEFDLIFNQADLDTTLKEFPNKLIVTQGGDGVVYYNGTEVIHHPARPSQVVDTTGAGDTFTGAFAVAIANQQTVDQAITFSNRMAGIASEQVGAQTGMPYIDNID